MCKTINIYSFFNKHLLSICVRPSGSTRLGDRAVRKTHKAVGLAGQRIMGEEEDSKGRDNSARDK